MIVKVEVNTLHYNIECFHVRHKKNRNFKKIVISIRVQHA